MNARRTARRAVAAAALVGIGVLTAPGASAHTPGGGDGQCAHTGAAASCPSRPEPVRGPAGAAGTAKGPRIFLSPQMTVTPGASETAVAGCPAGTAVTGGGFQYRGGDSSGLSVVASHALGDAWHVTMTNTGPVDRAFRAQVICLPMG
ncbi:hypothetical protein [Streptomyces sp. SDr-06]|uniref:hypothetical protein n=1 Tax=Streptomyces sp. SDr-06 TaxID=2267702 RepID=UPI0011C03FDD|nr:hypothetical protein [Streptomyces sp. SDr-06]